jgi:hypothetical protein
MTIKEHEQELADLVEYFKTTTFPPAPFPLNRPMVITDDPTRLFIPGQVLAIQTYRGSDHVRDSLFQHLRELKGICEIGEPYTK